jgi:polyhydroxyalkanoate synthase subunit PhaC
MHARDGPSRSGPPSVPAKDESMNADNRPEPKFPDPVEWSQSMAEIARRSQHLVVEFLERQSHDGAPPIDPLNVAGAFIEMTQRMMADPAKLIDAQFTLWRDYLTLWQRTADRLLGGQPAAPVAEPTPGDRRFKDEAWNESAVFDFIKQSYLLTARWMQSTVKQVDGLDDKTAQKVDFYTRQFVDALAPSNFVMTNPEVLRATMESGGENLLRGLEHLLADLERGKGRLMIKMTDLDAFKVGKNIAVSPGKVIYQNDLLQLLQYAPTTETVKQRPLLIIPPWINKYYILDLRPDNSFVRWAVSQGHTVFMVSWVNPDEKLAAKTFEDYMREGPLAALDAIEQATGERQINVIGYCLGGTLLAATLAYMAAKGDDRFVSATLLASLTDFKEAGELTVFIDEAQLEFLEDRMKEHGYLDGADMATTFNMLRANDLIWSFVVNNYLLGKEPFPFDLLYWNSDSTRMPAKMHSFYLRKMYQENELVKPGGITLAGVPIDLGKVTTPTFLLSSKEDHIAPWKATYAATQIFKGPVKAVLSASGHIAGVVNPPPKTKYGHWENDKLPPSPDDWFAGATYKPDSWWPIWEEWIKQHAGETVPARKPGDGKLKPIEDAPGSYVLVKAG